jgi:hypothetical protein
MNYFITETYLKNNTPITQNVDAKDVMPFVGPASDMHLQSLLGTFFYNHMLLNYNNQTLNADEFELYKKMQPIVAWRAASEAVYGLTYQLKNKGLQTQTGEQSDPADAEQVVMIKRHYDQTAEFYEERVRIYLIKNKDLFPQFTDKLNDDCSMAEDIRPTKESGYNNDMLMI